MIGGNWLKRIALQAGLEPSLINHSSVDVRMADFVKVPNVVFDKVRPGVDESGLFTYLPLNGGEYLLKPKEFIKTALMEKITVPEGYAAMFTLRSTWAQLSMEQATSVWIRPGWSGYLVLELFNFGIWNLALKGGDTVGQLHFFEVKDDPELKKEALYD